MGLSHCLWRIYFILIWRWLCSTGSLWWFRLPLSFFFLVGCLFLCEKGKCEAIPYRRGWVNTVHLKLSQKTNICLCLCTDITVCRKICWVFTKDLHPQPHICNKARLLNFHPSVQMLLLKSLLWACFFSITQYILLVVHNGTHQQKLLKITYSFVSQICSITWKTLPQSFYPDSVPSPWLDCLACSWLGKVTSCLVTTSQKLQSI